METTPVTAATLAEVKLFAGAGDQALRVLAEHAVTLHLKAEDFVFREGEPASELYVLLSGRVEVRKDAKPGSSARIGQMVPTSWFGEMSVIDEQPRSATIVAVEPSVVLKVTREVLDRLVKDHVRDYLQIVLNIGRELSRRLRHADVMIANLVANYPDNFARDTLLSKLGGTP